MSWLRPTILTPSHRSAPSSMRTSVHPSFPSDLARMTYQLLLPASRSPTTAITTISLDPHYAAAVRRSQLRLLPPDGCARSGPPPLSDLSITTNPLSPLLGYLNSHSRRASTRRKPRLQTLLFPRLPSPRRRRSVESSLGLISSFVIVTNRTSLRSEGGIAGALGPARRAPKATLLLD